MFTQVQARIGSSPRPDHPTQFREAKLISIREVDVAWAEIMLRIRNAVLSIPGRMRFGLPHMTAFDQRVMANICRDVLEETAAAKTPRRFTLAPKRITPPVGPILNVLAAVARIDLSGDPRGNAAPSEIPDPLQGPSRPLSHLS